LHRSESERRARFERSAKRSTNRTGRSIQLRSRSAALRAAAPTASRGRALRQWGTGRRPQWRRLHQLSVRVRLS